MTVSLSYKQQTIDFKPNQMKKEIICSLLTVAINEWKKSVQDGMYCGGKLTQNGLCAYFKKVLGIHTSFMKYLKPFKPTSSYGRDWWYIYQHSIGTKQRVELLKAAKAYYEQASFWQILLIRFHIIRNIDWHGK